MSTLARLVAASTETDPKQPPLPQRATKRSHIPTVTPTIPKVSPKPKTPRLTDSNSNRNKNNSKNHNTGHSTPPNILRSTRASTASASAGTKSVPTSFPSSSAATVTVPLLRSAVPHSRDTVMTLVAVPITMSQQLIQQQKVPQPNPQGLLQSPPPPSPSPAMIATQEALARLKTSDVSKDLTSFLDNFQTTVNQGFAFLKEKITDPKSGLETRVETLETLVNKKEAGLFDRVGKIESAITDEQGTSRIEKLENAVKKGLNSNSVAGAGAPQYVIANKEEARLVNQLITKTNDLEKRMGEIEFKNSVLTNWADTMFQDHHSLQRQVNFNTSSC